METKRKHVPTWLYKLGGRLDKQYEEIVSACPTSTPLMQERSDKALLDLLCMAPRRGEILKGNQ